MTQINSNKKMKHTYLEDELVARIDKAAEVFTAEKKAKEIEEGVPPSKRGRSVSRSKAIRQLVIKGLKEMGL